MGLLDWLTGRPSPRDQVLIALHVDVSEALTKLRDINHRITRMEIHMSADRDFLLELAQDLNDLAAPVNDLIADNAAKAAQIEELRGEVARLGGEVSNLESAAAADEAGDLDAARPARDALDLIRGKFAAKPDLPDITTPDAPAEPVADEPVVEDLGSAEPVAEPEAPAERL